MNGAKGRFGLAVGALALLGAVPEPSSPRGAQPGLWDVSLSATGNHSHRLCLPDPMILTQWEHRAAACTRVILSEHGTSATVHYTCTGGGFGQSVITLVTPRSIKVETQGIAGDLPFAYSLYARRAGNCSPR
ncbi:MAG: hypothetical protein ABIO85_02160 [Sphingomicrobium sp.]